MVAVPVFGKELYTLAQLVAGGKFNVEPYCVALEDLNEVNWNENKKGWFTCHKWKRRVVRRFKFQG
ncbi:hypothetical protein SAMN05216431_11420 [Ligilactobacillus sp. WC1T17]|uniref:Uncharacterized protein n=1 Tax=Ligilactobacillus ruminis TaxID=1623 RepID=A0ABY1ADK3_9LACO|nr:hypothetical protein SAMN05216431_11420 [Ligilactobacillus ruminis]